MTAQLATVEKLAHGRCALGKEVISRALIQHVNQTETVVVIVAVPVVGVATHNILMFCR